MFIVAGMGSLKRFQTYKISSLVEMNFLVFHANVVVNKFSSFNINCGKYTMSYRTDWLFL